MAINKKLNMSADGISTADGTANVISNIVEITVPKGLGYVIPGRFKLILKLMDDASGNEMPDDTWFAFGYKKAGMKRVIPIGDVIYYRPWADLSTDQQDDDDHARAVTVDLGKPFLPLREDEVFVIQAFHATGTVDISECEFEIPYAEGDAGDLDNEIKLREQWWM